VDDAIQRRRFVRQGSLGIADTKLFDKALKVLLMTSSDRLTKYEMDTLHGRILTEPGGLPSIITGVQGWFVSLADESYMSCLSQNKDLKGQVITEFKRSSWGGDNSRMWLSHGKQKVYPATEQSVRLAKLPGVVGALLDARRHRKSGGGTAPAVSLSKDEFQSILTELMTLNDSCNPFASDVVDRALALGGGMVYRDCYDSSSEDEY
jgi:hypothetical protein